MSKFRIKMKLTGLELEIEGSRDDVPQMAQSLGRQLGNLISPAAQIVSGEDAVEIQSVEEIPSRGALPAPAAKKKKPQRRRQAASNGAGGSPDGEVAPVDWRHDPTTWGTPEQGWNTATKAIWLLYVVSQATDMNELTAAQITATFNKHFRQAGNILAHNVTRDLGKQKLKKPAPVGEDSSREPRAWFLTAEGTRQAKALIAGDNGDDESEE